MVNFEAIHVLEYLITLSSHGRHEEGMNLWEEAKG
jgi:hypothetical protein